MTIIQITAITEGKQSKSEVVRYFKDETTFNNNYIFGERYEAKKLDVATANDLINTFETKYHPIQLYVSTPNGVFKSKKVTRYEFNLIEI